MAAIVYSRDLGLIDYQECKTLQEGIFNGLIAAKDAARRGDMVASEVAKTEEAESEAKETLLLCEHPHVYTLGRSGADANMLINDEFLARIGAQYVRTDRGGDITYHGPGQLVGYPILDLDRHTLGLKEYIHALEQSIIDTLAEFGIEAQRREGATGVWLAQDAKGAMRKISAIGVRSSRYVTMHGFALNVNPQMEYFSHINPCGFTELGVTSMQKELGREMDMEQVKKCYMAHFQRVFGVQLM